MNIEPLVAIQEAYEEFVRQTGFGPTYLLLTDTQLYELKKDLGYAYIEYERFFDCPIIICNKRLVNPFMLGIGAKRE